MLRPGNRASSLHLMFCWVSLQDGTHPQRKMANPGVSSPPSFPRHHWTNYL